MAGARPRVCEIGDVERNSFRLGRMRHSPDEVREGAEVAPIVAVRAFRRLRATGVRRRTCGNPEFGYECIDVAGVNRTGRPRECGGVLTAPRGPAAAGQLPNTRSTPTSFEPGRASFLGCEKTRLPKVRSGLMCETGPLLAGNGRAEPDAG